MGSAYLAGLAVGFWESREELDAKWQMARRFTPKMNPQERDRLYSRWQQAVERSLGWTQRES
jgi:glycerol kinase